MPAGLTDPPRPPELTLDLTVTILGSWPGAALARVVLLSAGATRSHRRVDVHAASPVRLAKNGVGEPTPCPCGHCRADARRSAASDRSVRSDGPPRYDLVATRLDAEALVGRLAEIGAMFSVTRHGPAVRRSVA